MEPWQPGTEIGGGCIVQEKLWSLTDGREAWRAVGPGGIPVEVERCPFPHPLSERKLQQLETLKGLTHPNLRQTIGYWADNSSFIVVTEATEGSLSDLLAQCLKDGEPGIPPRELLTYVQPAAAALDYLHQMGYLHRDISPEAILVKGLDGRLADLDMLTPIPKQRNIADVTAVGTPRYMAPERWKDQEGPASDQYSLAITWAELRLQRPVFPQQTMLQMMLDHLQTPPNLDALPEEERQVLLQALDKNPERRYPNCCAFVQALSEVIS